MDLTPYVHAIRDDLNTAAAAGDEQTARTAATLAAAVEPSARLALMNALSDLAAEITADLPNRAVEVRLDGRDVRVVITDTAQADSGSGSGSGGTESSTETGPASSSPPPPGAGGDISRMTLRLMEQLKDQAEHAAAAQGVSLNTFVSQAVQGALRGAGRQHTRPPHDRGHGSGSGSGSHLHGWVWG